MPENEIKTHPVQNNQRRYRGVCPQVVTMKAYEVYCEIYSSQEALITGDCRGGFGTGELIGYLYARSFPKSEWSNRFHEALKGAENL